MKFRLLLVISIFIINNLYSQEIEGQKEESLFLEINTSMEANAYSFEDYSDRDFIDSYLNNQYFTYGFAGTYLLTRFSFGLSFNYQRKGYQSLYSFNLSDKEDPLAATLPANQKFIAHYLSMEPAFGYLLFQPKKKFNIRPVIAINISQFMFGNSEIEQVNGEIKKEDKLERWLGENENFRNNLFSLKTKLDFIIPIYKPVKLVISPQIRWFESQLSDLAKSKNYILGIEATLIYKIK